MELFAYAVPYYHVTEAAEVPQSVLRLESFTSVPDVPELDIKFREVVPTAARTTVSHTYSDSADSLDAVRAYKAAYT